MQIVIDIDENVFTRLFDNGIEDYAIVNDDLFAIAKSIRNGIPLPKGHGDLIDRDALINSNVMIRNVFINTTLAPTIVKADKENK